MPRSRQGLRYYRADTPGLAQEISEVKYRAAHKRFSTVMIKPNTGFCSVGTKVLYFCIEESEAQVPLHSWRRY